MKKISVILVSLVLCAGICALSYAEAEKSDKTGKEGKSESPANNPDAKQKPDNERPEPPSGTKPATPAQPGEPGSGATPAVPAEPGKKTPEKPVEPGNAKSPETPGEPEKVKPPETPPAEAAKEAESKPASKEGEGLTTSWGGMFGAVSVDGTTYFMLSILMELAYEPWGVGFDVRLLWNDKDGVRKEEWKDWKKVLTNTFRYIRYNHKGDDLYAKLGVIDNATLGHGFIMRRYSNLQPTAFTRKWGTEFDLFVPGVGVGFESVTNDVMYTRVVGTRAFYRLPMLPLPVHVGGTYVWDRSPAKDKEYIDPVSGSTVPASAPQVQVYGADVGVQVFKTDSASLLVYSDIAKIKGHGYGFVLPGAAGKLFIFDYLAEYRNLGSDFKAGLFDALYEQTRPVEFGPAGGPRKHGYFAEIGCRPISWLYFLGSYERYYYDNSWLQPYVRLEASYTGSFIPKVAEVSLTFEQQLTDDRPYLTLKSPYSIAGLRLGAELAPGAVLLFTITQTWDPIREDYDRTTSMGVQLKF